MWVHSLARGQPKAAGEGPLHQSSGEALGRTRFHGLCMLIHAPEGSKDPGKPLFLRKVVEIKQTEVGLSRGLREGKQPGGMYDEEVLENTFLKTAQYIETQRRTQ